MTTQLIQKIIIFLTFCLLNFNAYAFLNIKLSTNEVAGGEKINLIAEGGNPPYLWLTEAGDVKVGTDNQATLTTPEIAGQFMLTLLDSKGDKATATFQVVWQKFSVSPQYIYLKPQQSVTIGLHGVSDKVKVLVDAGSWEFVESGNDIRYTAPDEPGFYALTFYQVDNPGDSRAVHVKVYAPLEVITPNDSEVLTTCAKKEIQPNVFLEEHETVYLQAKNGVPPYLWIEGGKGSIEYIDTYHNKVRYNPGEIIGSEIVSVYDSTGNFVDIQVTVKGLFRMSPVHHSVCSDNAIVTFRASGGECPYHLSPPSDESGYQVIEANEDSLQLKFTRAGQFDVVGSDAIVKTAIGSVTVNPAPCHCENCLDLGEPIYYYVSTNMPTHITASVKEAIGTVDWLCQGTCDLTHFNVTTGKEVTFYPPNKGHYELIALDQNGRTGRLAIHIESDLYALYAGANNHVEAIEMQKALDDFFGTDKLQKSQLHQLVEKFTSAD